MEKEKLKVVFDYFDDANIELPTDVHNAIEDVFAENDDVEGVECYHAEDISTFQEDISLKNNVKMFLDGKNIGEICNVWTYYGGISYSLTEHIGLYDQDGNELEEISDYSPEVDYPYSLVENPASYQVVLIERVKWDTSKSEYSRSLNLYIFCPEPSSEDLSEDDEKYDKIYNELKRGR